jgi:predicted RNA-binding Zn ribbon-like protein
LGSATRAIRRSARRGAGRREREDLAIRFVNTCAWRLRVPSEERLPDAQALLSWLRRNGIGNARRLQTMSSAWAADAEGRRMAYETAIALREAIYEVLVARIKGQAPPDAALSLFNGLLARALSGARLAWGAGELTWSIGREFDALDLLKPIVVSAAELMTGPRAGRVKQCQDDRGCGWLFVDESRAQNRRWCSMGDCGNRAKANRHYERVRGERT